MRACLLRTCLVPALLLTIISSAALSQDAEIHTSDTQIRLHAGAGKPQLIELQLPQGTNWRNLDSEPLIDHAQFQSRDVAIHWKLLQAKSHVDARRVAYLYESESPHLQLIWEWQSRAEFGPIEHEIQIRNLEHQPVWIPLQASLACRWKSTEGTALEQLSVEKGADTPSASGVHLAHVSTKYSWTGYSSTYAHPVPGRPREIIPWTLIMNQQGTGWYAGVEFSGNTRLDLSRTHNVLNFLVSFDTDPRTFRTRIEPGESFVTPTIFLGAFRGGADGAGNILRQWIKRALGNPVTWADPHFPFIVNNSWGSGTAVDEVLAHRMIRDSAEIGAEMFGLDAGWFRGVGDWYPDPNKFPHGLAPVADDAHAHSLKFGIWVDWAQAGVDNEPGALNAHDPKVRDWLTSDVSADWKPEEYKGRTIDISVPEARDWIARQLERMVNDFHLDMLEHDGYLVAQGCTRSRHPHAPPDPANLKLTRDAGFVFVESPNSADVSYHAARTYYDLYANLRQAHPNLLLEICNDGGRMVDFGSAAHGDYFSITDTYDPLSNRRAFYDSSYVLPPAMLEAYVERWNTPRIENFLYMLRSGMMGWLSIMMDTTAWSDEQHAAAKEELALYKSRLRPLIRNANLYHISERPDGVHWDAMEYFDPASRTGVVYVFRGSEQTENTHSFRLRGVTADKTYRLQFNDKTSPDRVLSGAELLNRGISLSLPLANSSELVFLTEVENAQGRP